MPPKRDAGAIDILELRQEQVDFCILGSSPLIYNRMAEKAKRELLLPARKNRASRGQTLKHDPIEEYRASVHRDHEDGPTRLVFPSPAFKGAMATAALEIPGATKSSIQRLCYVTGQSVSLFGTPSLYMSVVRQAGFTKAPDIRTRAILREWACMLRVKFVVPQLTAPAVSNLLAAAGVIVGVGDFRQEKGKGSFGQFELVSQDDARFQRILKEGRQAQDKALESPEAYDHETEELWSWFEKEALVTGRKKVAA